MQHAIDNWWKHNGCFDRAQASGIAYYGEDDYLERTDEWWDGLSDKEKEQVYSDFFDEEV